MEGNTSGSVWAFDLGKGSTGEAVRLGTRFFSKASLLIPAELGETKTAATRRRMMRTREAHKAREQWLERVWEEAGLEVLRGRITEWDKAVKRWHLKKEGDPRLEREFAGKGDDHCYTSCLLRIKLASEGEGLEAWQIFKALRSAIQKRGYEEKIPWAAKEAARTGKSPEELEKEEAQKDPEYVAAISRWTEFKENVQEEYRLPCYYEAEQMGLWNRNAPKQLKAKLDHKAGSTRKVRYDREDVRREVELLARNAAKRLPELGKAFERIRKKGWGKRGDVKPVAAKSFEEFLCYGPAGVAYASYFPEHRKESKLHLGSTDDWMGVLGQKVPRFDNRILNDCSLIPRFHVCKTDIRRDGNTGLPVEESLLAAEVTFLMKLRNTLVAEGIGQRKLRVEEVRAIFEAASREAKKPRENGNNWAESVARCYSLTEAAWARKANIKELGLSPLPGYKEIAAPKASGRSSFSRPALRLLKALLLSGEAPANFHKEQLAKLEGNTDPQKGLVAADLSFLLKMGNSWESICIPEQKLEAIASRHTEQGKLNARAAIRELVGNVKDPIVRHRLGVFAERLTELRKEFGEPSEVVLEFVREDFMGEKRKSELMRFQREREKARREAREQSTAAGATERSGPLKYELLKAQGGMCLYCGEGGQGLAATKLSSYEIDHIVPRESGGPDAMINYVLAHRECNEAKGKRTPFEWKHGTETWDAYKRVVEQRATFLRNKKVQLLLREDAPELVERYTALAETAWVSKLAQTIVSFEFGWKNGIDGTGKRRVRVISGGLTARVRRQYRLNSLLNPCPAGEDSYLWEEKCEKNRSDKRHHALDAMVLSYIPAWLRDETKKGFFRFPREVHDDARGYFEKELRDVMPENLFFEKARLAETIYGKRRLRDGEWAVQRFALEKLAYQSVNQKMVFKLEYLRDQIKAVVEPKIAKILSEFVSENRSEQEWRQFCATVNLPRKDGTPGPRIRRVLMKLGELAEYKDMSKDGSGAYRKALQGHKGQIVYVEKALGKDGKEKEVPKVRPIYAFESVAKAKRGIILDNSGKKLRIIGVFKTGCLIEITKPAAHAKQPLSSGRYILNTIMAAEKAVKVTTPDGRTYPVIPRYSLASMIEAGLRRID